MITSFTEMLETIIPEFDLKASADPHGRPALILPGFPSRLTSLPIGYVGVLNARAENVLKRATNKASIDDISIEDTLNLVPLSKLAQCGTLTAKTLTMLTLNYLYDNMTDKEREHWVYDLIISNSPAAAVTAA